MTREQIAAELAPYAQQMQPNLQAFATSQQQLYARGRERGEENRKEAALLTPMATAGALDPTGASKRAYAAAESALAAKRKSESEAEAAEKQADQLRNKWTTTEAQLAAAKKAAGAGDFDAATTAAREAEALAKASIFQATSEKERWKDMEIR